MSAEMKVWPVLVAKAQAGAARIYLDPTAKPDLERLAERDLADFIDFGDKIVAWLTPAGERKAFPAIGFALDGLVLDPEPSGGGGYARRPISWSDATSQGLGSTFRVHPGPVVEVTTFGDPEPRFMSAHDPRVSNKEPLDAQSIIDRVKYAGHLPSPEESIFLNEWFDSNQQGWIDEPEPWWRHAFDRLIDATGDFVMRWLPTICFITGYLLALAVS